MLTGPAFEGGSFSTMEDIDSTPGVHNEDDDDVGYDDEVMSSSPPSPPTTTAAADASSSSVGAGTTVSFGRNLLFPPFARILSTNTTSSPRSPPSYGRDSRNSNYDYSAMVASKPDSDEEEEEDPPVRVVDMSPSTAALLSDWGMVSVDGTKIVEDDNDSSPARMMAGSFEHVLMMNEDTSSRTGSGRGVLILDGLSTSSQGRHDGSCNNSHNVSTRSDGLSAAGGDDTLSVPGSDSLPSDPGTIHDEDGTMTHHHNDHVAFNLNRHHQGDDDVGHDGGGDDGDHWELDNEFRHRHRRHRRHYRSRSRSRNRNRIHPLRLLVDLAVGGKSHHYHHRRRRFVRSVALASLVLTAIVFPTAGLFYLYHKQRERKWQETLMEIQSENQRLLSQEEELRLEMELLHEEALIAAARAALAVQQQEEQRRLLLEQQEKVKEQEELMKRQSKDDEWWFRDGDDHGDGTATTTVLDNCWVKAKADIQLGECVEETRDFFKDLWDGLWKVPTISMMEYWEQATAMFEEELGVNNDGDDGATADEGKRQQDYNMINDDGTYFEDVFYPQYDPIVELMDALQSVGQTVAAKFSQLMKDESTRAAEIEQAVQEGFLHASEAVAEVIEQTVQEGFLHASETVAEAMSTAKADMKDLSKEALLALSAAIKVKNGRASNEPNEGGSDGDGSSTKEEEGGPSSPTLHPVTLKGLFDAVNAISSLSRSWNEAGEVISTASASAEFESIEKDYDSEPNEGGDGGGALWTQGDGDRLRLW